jgi:hypothetical protein
MNRVIPMLCGMNHNAVIPYDFLLPVVQKNSRAAGKADGMHSRAILNFCWLTLLCTQWVPKNLENTQLFLEILIEPAHNTIITGAADFTV